MPEKRTLRRARAAKRQGKSPSTQAGEFVRESIEHIRQGRHGARSTKQAIAIGLSEARRAGVKLPPPKRESTSRRTRRSAARDYRAGQSGHAHRGQPEAIESDHQGAQARRAQRRGTSRALAPGSPAGGQAQRVGAQRHRAQSGPHPRQARAIGRCV